MDNINKPKIPTIKNKEKENKTNKINKINKANKTNHNNKDNRLKVIIGVAAFIIIIIAVIFGAYEYYILPQQHSVSFFTFLSNFNSAPKISIVVSAQNSTELSYAIQCETQLILSITSSHVNYRAPSSMSLFVINGNNCTYLSGLGVYTSNYISTGKNECLNISSSTPSIFINYSNTNSTIIKQNALYFSGNAAALQMCGIAPEFTSAG
ncbi:MAG: hypothetical protein M1538_03155 [Candidatus Marsarchaeota archaeon]|nr:hypothetical protein [Candidatus Marsarchaeota archaeon]